MKKIVFVTLFLAFQAVLIFIGACVFWWKVPAAGTLQPIEFEVKEGDSFGQVALRLERIGAIRWPLFFRAYARLTRQADKIKAGPYTFEPNILPQQILAKLLKGEVSLVQFTIPEGWNTWQIAERLAATFPHITKEIWLQEMKSEKHLALLPSEATSLEGYLYPETYSIRTHPTASEVVQMLLNTFAKNFDPIFEVKGKDYGLTKHKIVTLASIIEKETRIQEERPRISSVFHNRLRRGMRLQTDPTVIYGIWERYDGNIRKKDLLEPTPYNTYVISGLPPGPIASPGRAALAAAVEPLTTSDLYFVAKADGSHVFSSTLSEHNRNVYTHQILPFRKSRQKK